MTQERDWTAWINVAGSVASIAALGYLLTHLPRRGRAPVVAGLAALPVKGRIPLDTAKRVMTRLPKKVQSCPGVTPTTLREGMEVEREHRDVTKGRVLDTAKIAAAHLCESPRYYRELKKMERRVKS